MRTLFLIKLFLISILCYSITAQAEEAISATEESEIQMEKEIIQEVEKEKDAQLKEYFRDYYYKEGIDYYNKGRYPEAIAKFKRALYWWPEHEPATKYIALTEDKINQQRRLEEEKKQAEEKAKEAQEAKKQEEIITLPVGEYRVDISDVLDISVWKVPDLSQREVIVRPDGKISLPLIGDVETVGLTLTQLDEEITKRYALYVRDPQVSVMIRSFGGRKVVVLGDVAKPGVYTYTSDIRLLEAIALAGDCTKYAVKKNILIIRGNIHKNPQVISSNMLAVIKNAKLSENVLIQPQDIVFVPRTLIGNVNTFLESIAPLIDTVYKGFITSSALDTF